MPLAMGGSRSGPPADCEAAGSDHPARSPKVLVIEDSPGTGKAVVALHRVVRGFLVRGKAATVDLPRHTVAFFLDLMSRAWRERLSAFGHSLATDHEIFSEAPLGRVNLILALWL